MPARRQLAFSFTVSDGNGWTMSGLAGNDSLTGGNVNDVLIGGRNNDVLVHGGGNDLFNFAAGDGVDSYDGGAGNDSVTVSGPLQDCLTLFAVINLDALTGTALVFAPQQPWIDPEGPVFTREKLQPPHGAVVFSPDFEPSLAVRAPYQRDDDGWLVNLKTGKLGSLLGTDWVAFQNWKLAPSDPALAAAITFTAPTSD